MKRSAPLRRTPLKPSQSPLKASAWQRRKPLRQTSLKRLATLPARRECVRIVLERDKGCVFWHHVEEHDPIGTEFFPKCWGQLDVHEPGHRSQGADPTDPDLCVALCRGHHSYVHEHPLVAKLLAL